MRPENPGRTREAAMAFGEKRLDAASRKVTERARAMLAGIGRA